MNKYFNRVQSEFEKILVELSGNYATTYRDALQKAEEYAKGFGSKKHLTATEQQSILDYCIELIQDWYPDPAHTQSFTF